METPSSFRKRLDSLPYDGRVREAARFGHAHRSLDDAWLDALAATDSCGEWLALHVAAHGQRSDRLLSALRSDCPKLAERALRLLEALGPPPAQLEALVASLPARLRERAVRWLSRCGDPARVRAAMAALEPALAARLLPGLPPAEMAQALVRLAGQSKNLKQVALARPRQYLDWIEAEGLARPRSGRLAFLAGQGQGLEIAARRLPHETLDAVERVLDDDLAPLPWSYLMLRCPDRVLRLLLRPDYRLTLERVGLPWTMLPQLRRLGLERLLELSRVFAHQPLHLARLLAACPPSWRTALFEAATEGQDLSAREHSDELLEALPGPLRRREAERMLELRSVRGRPDRLLSVAAFASLEVAEPIFSEGQRASRSEERGVAIAAWLQCCGRNRSGLEAVLTRLLARLKNEQDPVRLAAAQALVDLPPTLLAGLPLALLDTFVVAVVEARDSSYGTRLAVQELATRLLRVGALHPEGQVLPFALKTLARLVNSVGALRWPSLRDLPAGTEARILTALLDYLRSAGEREVISPVLGFATALGKRAWHLEPLQKLLEKGIAAKPDHLARSAADLWTAPPHQRDERVRKLLAKDASFILCQGVLSHVLRRRQDWLAPYLEPRALKGRFASGKTIYLLPVSRGFHRWLPRQQIAYGKLLLRAVGETNQTEMARAHFLKTFCHLPSTTTDQLRPYLNDPSVVVQEAVLANSVRLWRPAPSLDLLLPYLDSDRARVAMYAVPALARVCPPDLLSGALQSLLDRPHLKVTVHKEVLRLVGAYRLKDAEGILRRAWERSDLHKDVRIAVLHAARACIDLPWPFALLTEGATHPESWVARSLVDADPHALEPEARMRYALLLTSLCDHGDARVRIEAYRALPGWSAGCEDAVAARLVRAVSDLSLGPEWQDACHALVLTGRSGPGSQAWLDAVNALLAAPRGPEAESARDLPARQRLATLVDGIAHLSERALPIVARCAKSLEPTPHAMRLWLRAGRSWEELSAMGFADELIGFASSELRRPDLDWTTLDALHDSLGPSSVSRRLALCVVAAAGAHFSWPASWRERLVSLRQHADPELRWRAEEVYTAVE